MRAHHLLGSLVVLVIVALVPQPVDACSCVGPRCGDLATADAVLEATVARIERVPRPDGRIDARFSKQRVHLHNVRAFRGEPVDFVETGAGDGDCGYSFSVGTRYVIEANRRGADGQLETGTCTWTRPVSEAGDYLAYMQSLAAPSQGGRIWGAVATPGPVEEQRNNRERGGQPVAGATVSLSGPLRRTVTTAANGHYSFSGLPPGNYAVSVEAPKGRRAFTAVEPQTVALHDAYACADLDFWTRVESSVQGTVVDEGGKSVPRVSLDLHSVGWSPYGRTGVGYGATTDARGRFRFPRLAPGRYVVGIALVSGPQAAAPYATAYGRDSAGNVELVIPDTGDSIDVQPLTLRALTPQRVHGTLIGDDGQPAANTELRAHFVGERGPAPVPSVATTAADGSFTLDLFAGQRYVIQAARGRRMATVADIVASDEPLTITLRAP